MISSQTKWKIEKNVYERQFWRGKQQGVKETEKKEKHRKQERERHTEGRGVKRVIESETERGI